MAASASSSSQKLREKFDVFISFRGSDTRHGFLSHLQRELRLNHIDVYVDDRLERGEEIPRALMKAIEGSMISLVIFSKDYASSKWCLDELVKIIECKKINRQIVIPVFYNIDPSDVRHQKGSYADAFAQHKEKFKDNTDRLLNWRSVLNQIAKFSGYDSSHFQNESKLIVEIVDNILKRLEHSYPSKSRGSKLVGIYQNVSKFRSLMEIEPHQVQFLGIWGTGGIGKTTLAREIFEHFSSQFESSCFLENVRARSKNTIDGSKHLRQELLSQLLNQRSLDVNAVIGRLQEKKVLIVLDDVEDAKQVEDLGIENETCLGWGSKVIITSRDKHVLRSTCIDEEYIHEMKELDPEKALQLFCLNAFKQNHPDTEFEELSKKTVAYAQGIPLALEVLGLHFISRSSKYWEDKLRQLRKCPNHKIQNILKVSYDGLNAVEKKIFLDIAFFFVGEQEDKVRSMLEAFHSGAISGIENLVNKALIKISDHQRIIEMHDLIQDMGKEIVREESPDYPEERSRLNDSKELFDVLKNNMGTKKIQGIAVNLDQIEEVQLRADTFTKMRNLRIMKFYNSRFVWPVGSHIMPPHDVESFPGNLKYFHWDVYPSESLPLGFCPENFVEFRMVNSKLKKLWDGVQDLPKLETIDLSFSRQLLELPDFSRTRKLQTVNLMFCGNLRSVHPSVLSHTLVKLDVSYCSRLESLESEAHLRSLSDLKFDGCGSLKKFCLTLEKLETLKFYSCKIEILHLPTFGQFTKLGELWLNGSKLRSLPINEFRCFTNLETFRLEEFHRVIHKTELETLFAGLRCLKHLSLDKCSRLLEIPENISTLTELETLSLEGSSVEILPACIQRLSNLRYICLYECRKLRSILGVPLTVDWLVARDCTSLETISWPSQFLHDEFLDHTCYLDFKNCVKLDEPSLVVVEKLIQSSIISALKETCWNTTSYPGSSVPNWMRHKQMASEA